MTENQLAALVCSHVASGDSPILMAVHDEPVGSEDSGWQFLCGQGESAPPRVWSLSEVMERYPELKVLLDEPIGRSFVREREGAEWIAYHGAP
jgi:hypothetical protein